MTKQRVTVVVGADGFVGGGLAEALGAARVVYGPCREGDVHVTRAEGLLEGADVIINAGGFRVRRGLTYEDYRRCHEVATRALIPRIRRDALFVHMSSAHVLGKSPGRAVNHLTAPDPTTYPSAEYALAKLEADRLVERAAAERGFRAAFLRPTILYGRRDDTSLPDNLCKLARRGAALRLHPRDARHHLCHLDLLADVCRRVIAREDLPSPLTLLVSDPYTVTSRDLEEMIGRHLGRRALTIPVLAPLLSTLLRRTMHSRNPKYDLRTWGDILGVFYLDTVYDSSETFRLLEIDPARYAREETLEPFIRQALERPQASFGDRGAHLNGSTSPTAMP
jgi:nucleoside-diphosphate-sugar epimerase